MQASQASVQNSTPPLVIENSGFTGKLFQSSTFSGIDTDGVIVRCKEREAQNDIQINICVNSSIKCRKLRVTQCSQFLRRAHFLKKTGAFLAKIQTVDRRKDGQNSSFACLLLQPAVPLRVQSIIELLKLLTNALNVH